MKLVATVLKDVFIVEPQVFGDNRGFFMESFNQRRFDESIGAQHSFVQDNQSRSSTGVLRGLHYQRAPHAQAKLVRVTRGSVFDVAVDVRRSSPTFGQWVGVELSDENHRQLWIPVGFAHGYAVTSETAEVLYKTTDYYTPSAEVCIRWDDPAIGVRWPLTVSPVLSAKDLAGVMLDAAPVFD